MTDAPLRLGIDLGTSAVKAAVLDESGEAVAGGEAAFPTIADQPGQAEQETRHWLEAAGAAVAETGRQLGGNWQQRIAGIGLAGQLPTLVGLGEYGPLGPAIAWSDGRADGWAAGLLDEDRRAALYRRTGMPIDGRYLGPMYRFHWYDRRAGIRRILSAKDYLCHALTGAEATDPSTAAGYGVFALDGSVDPALCALWDLDPALLPELRPAESAAGPLSAAGAACLGLPPGLPVAVGAADSVAGALAMMGQANSGQATGELREGIVCLVMGSSTIVIDAVKEPQLDPRRRYLLTPHARAGWFGREMDLLATGSGYRWLGQILGWGPTEIERQAAGSVPGARGLFFAPYLAGGEQGALWDPSLSGVLQGLRLHHGAGDIARSFLEGVQFEIRRCLEVLAETRPVERILLAGHMAESKPSLQMLADILRRPVEPFAFLSPAALGAALLAPGPGWLRRPPAKSHASFTLGAAAGEYDVLYRRYLATFPRLAASPEE
jgi:xylulokinase